MCSHINALCKDVNRTLLEIHYALKLLRLTTVKLCSDPAKENAKDQRKNGNHQRKLLLSLSVNGPLNTGEELKGSQN